MAKSTEEYPIIGNCFEYDGKMYDCSYAIKRDTKLIIQEAETSHKDYFDELYDRGSLKAGNVRLFFENNQLLYGMIIYSIKYKENNIRRCACGDYYPFWEGKLMPHPYQGSICW
jgi:hypothetical protein